MEKEWGLEFWTHKIEKVILISKEYGYPEQNEEFWVRQVAGVMSLIINITEANARAISVVSELIEACKEMISDNRTDCNDRNCGQCSWCKTKQVLKKAKGEVK